MREIRIDVLIDSMKTGPRGTLALPGKGTRFCAGMQANDQEWQLRVISRPFWRCYCFYNSTILFV